MSGFPLGRAVLYGSVFAVINLIFLDTPPLRLLVIAVLFGILMGAFDMYFDYKHGKKIRHEMKRMEQGATQLKKGRKRR